MAMGEFFEDSLKGEFQLSRGLGVSGLPSGSNAIASAYWIGHDDGPRPG